MHIPFQLYRFSLNFAFLPSQKELHLLLNLLKRLFRRLLILEGLEPRAIPTILDSSLEIPTSQENILVELFAVFLFNDDGFKCPLLRLIVFVFFFGLLVLAETVILLPDYYFPADFHLCLLGDLVFFGFGALDDFSVFILGFSVLFKCFAYTFIQKSVHINTNLR